MLAMADSHSGTEKAFIEVIYEGDHCLPCVYMAEVVEEAVKKFGDRVKWTKVVLKRRPGAQRFAELAVKNKGVPPIPSLFVDEKLAFDMIPPVEDLEDYLEKLLQEKSGT